MLLERLADVLCKQRLLGPAEGGTVDVEDGPASESTPTGESTPTAKSTPTAESTPTANSTPTTEPTEAAG